MPRRNKFFFFFLFDVCWLSTSCLFAGRSGSDATPVGIYIGLLSLSPSAAAAAAAASSLPLLFFFLFEEDDVYKYTAQSHLFSALLLRHTFLLLQRERKKKRKIIILQCQLCCAVPCAKRRARHFVPLTLTAPHPRHKTFSFSLLSRRNVSSSTYLI